jgi:hypothetical protein
MKNLFQYMIATLIVLSGALALFSGYQVNRRGEDDPIRLYNWVIL